MTPEEAVAMELINVAMALTKASTRVMNKRDLCDVLICRAIYVLNESEPLVDYDADIITLLKSAGTDADAWFRAFKGETS